MNLATPNIAKLAPFPVSALIMVPLSAFPMVFLWPFQRCIVGPSKCVLLALPMVPLLPLQQNPFDSSTPATLPLAMAPISPFRWNTFGLHPLVPLLRRRRVTQSMAGCFSLSHALQVAGHPIILRLLKDDHSRVTT